MVWCPLSQVTVYGRLVTLIKLPQCLRKPDVDFFSNLRQINHADAPVHDGIAVRADRFQVPKLFGNRQVVRHISCGGFRGAAADAIEFRWLTRPLVFCPLSLEECSEILA